MRFQPPQREGKLRQKAIRRTGRGGERVSEQGDVVQGNRVRCRACLWLR